MAQSDKTLSPPPISSPLLTPDGLLTTPWASYFQNLQVRVGGGSTDPLNSTNATLTSVAADVSTLDTTVATQGTTLAAVKSTVDADHVGLTALQHALNPDAGTWVPAFSGATMTGTVSVSGRWKSIGELIFFDVQIDATGGSIAFASAQITNMPVAAARPGTLAAVDVSTYADHGNGLVVGNAAQIPNYTLSAGKGVLMGRYIR